MPGNDFVGPDWRGAVPRSRQNKNVPRDSNARFRHIIPTKQSLDRIAAVRRDQVPPQVFRKIADSDLQAATWVCNGERDNVVETPFRPCERIIH
jgi:hypothetical protein